MQIRDFTRNALVNIFATAIPLCVTQFIVLPYLSKSMSAEQYGVALTVISLFSLFSFCFGNVLSNIRLINNETYVRNGFDGDFNILLLFAGILNALLVFFCAWYCEGEFRPLHQFLCVVIASVWLAREYYAVAFLIEINYKTILYDNIVMSLGYLLGMVLYRRISDWLWIYAIGQIAGLIYVMTKTAIWQEPLCRTPLFRTTLVQGAALQIGVFLSNFATYADRVVLYPILGGEAVAVYFAASFVGKMMSTALLPINNVLFSYLAKMQNKSNKLFYCTILGTIALATGGYLICIFCSRSILAFLYPVLSVQAQGYVAIATAAACIGLVCSVAHSFILKFYDTRFILATNGATVLVYIIASIVLSNSYGLFGFCWATVASKVIKLACYITINALYKAKQA